MRNVLLFSLLFFVSTSSFAAFVDSKGKRFETMDSALSFYLNQCIGPVHRGLYYGYTSGKISGNSLVLSPYKYSDSSCEKPYSIVGGSTVIKLTEICEPPKIANEVTGICEEPDFCQSSQFLGLVAAESNACAAQYPDHYTNFSHSCKSSSNYSFTCNQGAPKPPTGGDGSGSGGDGSGSGGDGSGSGGDGSGSGGDGSGGDGSGSGGDGSGSGGDGSGGDGSGSGGDGSGSGGDGSGSGGDGSGSGGGGSGSGSGGSGGSGSGSGGGGSGSGGSGSVDLSGVITKINESNRLLNDLKTSSDSVGSAIGANGTKLDELGTKLDKLSEGSKTSVSANNCQSDGFSCSGNAYECFVARSAWKNNCLISSMTSVDEDYSSSVPTDISNRISNSGDALISDLQSYSNHHIDADKLSNGEVAITDALNKFDESNGLSFDEQCPQASVIDTGVGIFTIDYTPFCDLALYIRAMLMLFSSIGSLLMISKFS